MNTFATIRSEARFSDCNKYRFWLSKQWSELLPIGAFLLINPSSSDAIITDPTTDKCARMALLWGWRGFIIVNLDPIISSSIPSSLASDVAIRDANDDWIRKAIKVSDTIVIGTGADGEAERKNVFSRIPELESKSVCIGKNLNGNGYVHPGKPGLEIPQRPLPL